LRRFGGFQGSFDRLRHVMALVLPAAMMSTLVSATTGVLSLIVLGPIPADQFWLMWRAWWVGDALGDLLVAPLLLTWAATALFPIKEKKKKKIKMPTLLRAIEAASLAVILSVVCYVVFFDVHAAEQARWMAPFATRQILFPFFVWAAVRFGLRGATATTAL